MVQRSNSLRRVTSSPRSRTLAWLPLSFLLIAGCDLPRDPEGTLKRAAGGPLRVGVSVQEPWTAWNGDETSRPSGIEPELVERFAEELGAEVIWVRGPETRLLESLERFDLDLVIGGLTEDTLWAERIGLSQSYLETPNGEKHVLAAPPGENAFLVRLDEFLARQGAAVRRRLASEIEAR